MWTAAEAQGPHPLPTIALSSANGHLGHTGPAMHRISPAQASSGGRDRIGNDLENAHEDQKQSERP